MGVKRVAFRFWDEHPIIGKATLVLLLIGLFYSILFTDFMVVILMVLLVSGAIIGALCSISAALYDWIWVWLKKGGNNDQY